MKSRFYVLATVLILAGGVFFLQGLRLLPSRLMYGQFQWVIIGAVMIAVGAGLIAFANRRAARTGRSSGES